MNREKQIEETCTDCTHYAVCPYHLTLHENKNCVHFSKQSPPISYPHENGGDWVRVPCKVGDVLYVISQMKDKRFLPFINEYEVTSIKIGKRKCLVYHEMDEFIKIFKQDDFGRTVFLTREEAEKALAERSKQ